MSVLSVDKKQSKILDQIISFNQSRSSMNMKKKFKPMRFGKAIYSPKKEITPKIG